MMKLLKCPPLPPMLSHAKCSKEEGTVQYRHHSALELQ